MSGRSVSCSTSSPPYAFLSRAARSARLSVSSRLAPMPHSPGPFRGTSPSCSPPCCTASLPTGRQPRKSSPIASSSWITWTKKRGGRPRAPPPRAAVSTRHFPRQQLHRRSSRLPLTRRRWIPPRGSSAAAAMPSTIMTERKAGVRAMGTTQMTTLLALGGALRTRQVACARRGISRKPRAWPERSARKTAAGEAPDATGHAMGRNPTVPPRRSRREAASAQR
mmetsp:Transcript_13090/g.38450  ORF Transcript_13090/g.38450 Transcript_13090/m.38450 type:complete len:223 (+) Transcript_13090:259-927(+)